MPKISIISACYNSEELIEQLIISVKNQTYNDWELWFIDGESKDNTLQIIKTHSESDHRIKYISEKDNGIYDALNKGISLAKGEWLYFIGTDDFLYDNNVLENIFSNYNEIRQYHIIHGYVFVERINDFVIKKCENIDQFLIQTYNHQSLFYKKCIFEKYGLYDLKYKIHADRVFNLKWYVDPCIKKIYLDICIAKYSGMGLSYSHRDIAYQKDLLALYKIYLINHLKKDKIYHYAYLWKQWEYNSTLRKGNFIEASTGYIKLIWKTKSITIIKNYLHQLKALILNKK